MNAILKGLEAEAAKEPQYSQRQRAVLDVLVHAADELTRKDIYERLPKDTGLWSMSEQLGRNQVSKVLCDLFDLDYVAKRSEAGSGCLLWRLAAPAPVAAADSEPAPEQPAAPVDEAPAAEPAVESPASWADVVELSSQPAPEAAPLGAELPPSLLPVPEAAQPEPFTMAEILAEEVGYPLPPLRLISADAIPHTPDWQFPPSAPSKHEPPLSLQPLPGATPQTSDDLAEAVIAAAVQDQAYWRQPFIDIKCRLNALPPAAIADYGQKLSLLDGLLDALGSALPPPHLDTLRAIRQDLTNIHNAHQETRRHG